MNPWYELVFLLGRVFFVIGGLWLVAVIGMLLYERYWVGNVDAFKAERRVGPPDRRVGSGA